MAGVASAQWSYYGVSDGQFALLIEGGAVRIIWGLPQPQYAPNVPVGGAT
jgi:hypothetical protein